MFPESDITVDKISIDINLNREELNKLAPSNSEEIENDTRKFYTIDTMGHIYIGRNSYRILPEFYDMLIFSRKISSLQHQIDMEIEHIREYLEN